MILETARLILREMTPQDAEQAYLLNLDPEVIQYTGDIAFESISEAGQFLENYDHYRKYSFGRWAVIRKADGAFLGWCGLKYTASLAEYDIGYRFFKKYWNSGYASEAAQACLKLGFEKYGMPVIVGRVMKVNKASIRVLEKIGLKLDRSDRFEDTDWLIYKMNQPI